MLAQLCVNALISGAIYALLACAMAVMLQLSRAYNFALGHILVLVSYLFICLQSACGGGVLLVAMILICFAPPLALLTRVGMIAPFERHGALAVMIATLVCASLIEAALLVIFGPDFQRPVEDPTWSSSLSFGSANFSLFELNLVALSLLSIICVNYFLCHGSFGRKYSTLCDNRAAASALGINISTAEVVAYSIAMIWVVLAAVFAVFEINTQAALGFVFTLKALAVLTCVDARDLRRVLIAALVLGLLENLIVYADQIISISYKDAIAVAVMTLALLIRRQPLISRSPAI